MPSLNSPQKISIWKTEEHIYRKQNCWRSICLSGDFIFLIKTEFILDTQIYFQFGELREEKIIPRLSFCLRYVPLLKFIPDIGTGIKKVIRDE